MQVRRLHRSCGNLVDVDVEEAGEKLWLGETRLLGELAQGAGGAVGVGTLHVSTGLQPAVELCVVDEQQGLAVGREGKDAGGEVSGHELVPGEGRLGLQEIHHGLEVGTLVGIEGNTGGKQRAGGVCTRLHEGYWFPEIVVVPPMMHPHARANIRARPMRDVFGPGGTGYGGKHIKGRPGYNKVWAQRVGENIGRHRQARMAGDVGATGRLWKQAGVGAKTMAKTGMGKLGKQASSFKNTLKNIPTLIKNIKNPLGLILKVMKSTTFIGIAFGVALGIAAAVFATIKGDWENFKNAMEPGINALKEAWGALMDGVKAIIAPIVDLFNKFSFGAKKGETQGTALGKIFVAALQPVIFSLNVLATLFKTLGFVIGIAVDIAQPVLNLLFNLITPIVEIVKMVISMFKLDFGAALQHLNRAVGSIMISIIRLFGTMFEFVVKGMMSFTYVTEGLIRLLARIPGMGFLDHVADGIQSWRDGVNAFAGDAVDAVIGVIGATAGIDESEMFGFRDEEVRDIAGEAGSLFGGSLNRHHLSSFDGCLYIDWPAAVFAVGNQIKFSIPSRPV